MEKEDLQKVAKLARLKLTDQELETFSVQINDIVAYVEQLNEVDTTDIEPTSQVTGLMNVLRKDKFEDKADISSRSTRDELLANAPEVEDGYVRVPGVFSSEDE